MMHTEIQLGKRDENISDWEHLHYDAYRNLAKSDGNILGREHPPCCRFLQNKTKINLSGHALT